MGWTMIRSLVLWGKKKSQELNGPLLLFLVLILNVKLYIKVLAILFALIIHWKTPVSRELFRKKSLWFYGSMIILASVNLVLSFSSLSVPALLAFGCGVGYWLLAMAAARFLFLFVQQGERKKLHRTAETFFQLSAIAVLVSFLRICIESGSANPYTYEGEHRKYFISTGDLVTGISLDGSVTTALISAFGLLYFFYRGKRGWSLVSLIAVLLAGSNFTNLLLIGVFLFAFIFRTDRVQKSMILVYFLLMIVFWVKVSPQNKEYAEALISRVAGKNAYVDPIPLPHPRPNEFVEKKDIVEKRARMDSFLKTLYPADVKDSLHKQYTSWDRSGRWIAWQELRDFFLLHPGQILLGTGMGRFSSRLAFKTAALGIDGAYPQGLRYIHPDFRNNYLYIYLYYHTRDEGQHSVINKPDSVYGQLLSEYGLAGLTSFLLFYVRSFSRKKGRFGHGYGLPLLLLAGGSFITEYWFEQLSIVILFEFLMLLNESDGENLQNPVKT
jgi:hypothetical protein